ncbi:MAG: hypothetical protein ACRDMJ_06020, partial [Solirubrobacteraceae bacterium]
GGGFPQATCTLVPSQSGPTSYCSQNYDPPAGGIPTGSQPAITATYSGDATFGPSSAQPQGSVATGTGTESTSTTESASTTESTTSSSPCTQPSCPCPLASAPVDDVSTPMPPSSTEGPRASALRNGLIQIPTGVDPYCRLKTTYTAAEKKAAGDWNVYYADQSALDTAGAAVSGGIGVAAAAIPEPSVSKGVALAYGVYTMVSGLSAAYYSHLAALETVVQNDPPDRHWRTVVAAPATGRFAVPAGLRSRAAAALRSYEAELLAAQADAWCVQTAINRGSTAVSHHNLAIAQRQYVAGARCATAQMRAERAISRRFSALRGAVLLRLPRLTGAQQRMLAARARSRRLRMRAVNRLVASLARTTALPSGLAARLRAAASAATITPRDVNLHRLPVAPVSTAASAKLAHQEAEILAAAARADARALRSRRRRA